MENYTRIADLFKVAGVKGKKILKLGVETQDAKYNKMIRELSVIAAKAGKHNPILLLGETGVGKTVLAESIYKFLCDEKIIADNARFQHINCAALPTSIVESELFGFEVQLDFQVDHGAEA